MSDGIPDFNNRNGGQAARLWLLTKHMDRCSDQLVKEGAGSWLDGAAKWMEILVSHELDADKDFLEEFKRLEAEYADDERPSNKDPRKWRYERRLDEMEVIMRHITKTGAMSKHEIPLDDTILGEEEL